MSISSNAVITHRGNLVDPFKLDGNVYDIHDIAHSLSHICRWNGHCRNFYSVAQHCVRMFDALPDGSSQALQRRILLHDASEAYLTDFPTPVKRAFPGYKAAEDALGRRLYEHFGLEPEHHEHDAVVEVMDKTLAGVEAAQLGLCPDLWLHGSHYELTCRLAGKAPLCWLPLEAKAHFLARAEMCGISTEPQP